jgi:hypothetical protein
MFDEFGFPMYPEGAFKPRAGGSMRLHGGKGGSSAPPPDPRLTEAQITSMGYQDRAIQQMMANNSRLAPLQEQEMRDGITRSGQLYAQSQDDRVYGLERRGQLTGLQDTLARDAASFNQPARQEQLAGQAQADVTAAYGNMAGMQQRALNRAGVNPGSGRSLAMGNSNAIAQAAASAGAANKTRQAARLEGFALTDRATNAFAGYPASTASAVGTGASVAGMGLNMANAGLAGMNSGYGASGTAAGQMGQNASSMYGAQASYKNNQDQIAASNDPFNSILGAAAGVGMAYATGGLSYGRKAP